MLSKIADVRFTAGVYTTEFWATIAFNVAVLAASLSEAIPGRVGAFASSVSVVGYAIARGLAKFHNGNGQPPVPPE